MVGGQTRRAIATKLGAVNDVLRQGDRGDAVRVAQQRLDAAGFGPGPIAGIFGPRTHSAVIDFQSSEDLKVDGIVGRQTWAALLG